MPDTLFHLSIAVSDLAQAKAFYAGMLGCAVGREKRNRFDIDFFGHHVVAHLVRPDAAGQNGPNTSDGAPVRHFGVIVPYDIWKPLADRLQAAAHPFTIAPQVMHPGSVKEQHIMLLPDGCGNVIEFKSMPPERVFAPEAA